MNTTKSVANPRGHVCRPPTMGRITFALLLTAAICLSGNVRAQLSGTIVDFGAVAPTPGADDISQLLTGGGSPDGLNYYFDNGSPPGQTFTTGGNPNGYVLNSVYIGTAGNGNLPAGGQAYILRVYSVSNNAATLMYSYTSQTGFTFTETDWLQWTNLPPIGLQPNAAYAYSLRRVTTGWENMANVSGNPYAGGEVALIPTGGGAMTLGSSHGFDASFDVALIPANSITVNPPIIAPQSAVVAGTAVTIRTPPAVGPGPLYYQWRTDSGSGGTLTNVPSGTNTTLSVSTTGLTPGSYRYAVVVTNSTSSVTSAVVVLAVFQVAGATLNDVGPSVAPGLYDISQLTGGGNGDGLNYYDDNGNPPGQTFTTGTNSQGYYLTSVTLGTGGGTFNSTGTPQGYNLWLYSITGNTATLLINYTNASFSFSYGDWLTWSGFIPYVLKPNSTYAYTFHRNSTGWAGMANSPTTSDLYTNGQICLIPQTGGTVVFGNTGTSDAAFSLGLLPIGVAPTTPFAGGISFSPSRVVVAGSQVTLNEAATGASPLHYQWQTDGGAGGTLTNIPSSNVTNLVLNTAGWNAGVYQFDVIVTNSYGSSTSVVAALTVTYADTNGILADIGTATPLPVAVDISQLTGGGPRKPDGLNYYTDNDSPPGQTFTPGGSPQGYTLTSLAVHTSGDSGALPPNGQAYQLRLYSMSGTNTVLYATYTSQTNFTFVDSDWLRWSALNLPLAANTVYAYSFGRLSTGSGWENLDNAGGNVYGGGEVALIPRNGGPIAFGSSDSYDATFVVGLAVSGYPNVGPATFSPANIVYAGTPLTVNASVVGTGPFTYQWQTDGGNTGSLTNIPGATGATLSVNTTTLGGLSIAYCLVAANGSGSTTGETAAVTINPASPPIVPFPYSLPENNVVIIGGAATLQVGEVGTLPMTNQWTLNGVPLTDNSHIIGSTSNVLKIVNVQSNDAGYYQLNITNSAGAYTSYPGGGADQNLTVVAVPTFLTNGLGWTLNGSPSILNNVLTLTSGGGQAGSFFFNSSVYIGAFQASFIYQDVGSGGADGFTFCLHNDPRGTTAQGGGGAALGVSGISPSAELTFNIFASNIPGMSFGTNGANGAPFNPTGPVDVSSGDSIAINIVYLNGVLQVTLTDTNTSATYSTNIPVNLPVTLGSQQAYMGFTASSGGVASTQTITDFAYVPLTSLAMQLFGPNVLLTWPAIPGGYVLQSTPSLTSPNWGSVGSPVNQVSGQSQVTNSIGAGKRFYRLAIPIPAQ